MYTTASCGFCHAARVLLDREGLAFEQIDVTTHPEARDALAERTDRTTVPQMFVRHREQRRGGGKIINVTSIHEDIPNPGGAGYDCSESALRMLTRTLSLEVAENGINVNDPAPGMALTPFNQPAIDDPDLLDEQVQSIPLKRAAQPEEIARLALFITSIDSDYVTGSTYVMDGGLMRSVGQGA